MEVEFMVAMLVRIIYMVFKALGWFLSLVVSSLSAATGLIIDSIVVVLFALAVLLPSIMVVGRSERPVAAEEAAPPPEGVSAPVEGEGIVLRWEDGRELGYYQVLSRVSRAILDALSELSEEPEVPPDLIESMEKRCREILEKSEEKIRELEEIIRLREEMERKRMEIVRELREEFKAPPALERPAEEVAPGAAGELAPSEVPEGERPSVIKEVSKELEEQLKRLRKALEE